MSADGHLGLWLLALSVVIGLLGTWDMIVGAARRDELRERALSDQPPSLFDRVARGLDAAFTRSRPGRRLSISLVAAGVARTPLQFVLAALAAGLAVYVVLGFVFSTFIAVLGGLGAIRGAWWWLARRREKRKESFVAQLPELARTLSNATSAGLSVSAALEIAVTELGDPASAELSLALEEVRIGASFDEALSHLGDRMPSRELGVLVNTLVIQQRSGGDLVRALADMADTLEARKDTLREVKTLMAGAVTTAYIVAALGIASVFLIDIVKPGSLDKLTGSPVGVLVILASGTLYGIGFVLVRQVTRIET